jgi:hypothetical protein
MALRKLGTRIFGTGCRINMTNRLSEACKHFRETVVSPENCKTNCRVGEDMNDTRANINMAKPVLSLFSENKTMT